jgi:hypothetical protein
MTHILSQKSRKYFVGLFLVGISAVALAACSSRPADLDTTNPGADTTDTKSSVAACAQPIGSMADELKLEFDKTETFGAQDNAYALTYPTKGGWQVTDSGDIVSMFVNMKNFDLTTILNVQMTQNFGKMKLDKLAESRLNALKTEANFQLVEDCATEIKGVPARKITWTGDFGSWKNLKAYEYVLEKNDKVFNIRYMANQSHFDKYAGSAEKIVSSLDVK